MLIFKPEFKLSCTSRLSFFSDFCYHTTFILNRLLRGERYIKVNRISKSIYNNKSYRGLKWIASAFYISSSWQVLQELVISYNFLSHFSTVTIIKVLTSDPTTSEMAIQHIIFLTHLVLLALLFQFCYTCKISKIQHSTFARTVYKKFRSFGKIEKFEFRVFHDCFLLSATLPSNCFQIFINLHKFIYSHHEVSNCNSMPYSKRGSRHPWPGATA